MLPKLTHRHSVQRSTPNLSTDRPTAGRSQLDSSNQNDPLRGRDRSSQKPIDFRKMMVVAVASAVSAGVLAGVSTSLNRALGDGMRVPRLEDINYQGFETAMMRSFLKGGVATGVNRFILFALSHMCQSRTPEESSRWLVCLATMMSTIVVAAMFSPADQIKHHQVKHGGSMLEAVNAIMNEDGIEGLYRGVVIAMLIALPSQIGRALSEHLAQGDREKEKEISKTYTMAEAPTTSFLLAVKQVQNTSKSRAILPASLKAGQMVLEKPLSFVMHIGLGMAFVQVGKSIYFCSSDLLKGALAQVSITIPPSESDPNFEQQTLSNIALRDVEDVEQQQKKDD